MTAVWDHAAVSGGTLLVLLAMADWANDDGTGVYPKQETLAAKARLSDRQVRNCLIELEELGYIVKDGKRGHVVCWRVDTDPENIASRQSASGSSGSGVPTEPSTEPPEDEANASPSRGSGLEMYAEPATPGSAAAPWLVLELARLMRANDPKAKLPVGIRELMAPEYLEHYGHGKAFAGLDKRRELVKPVFDVAGTRGWLDAMRLLIDADERDGREVAQVLRWCQANEFWKTNILGAPKFRKQYPQLRLKWLEEGGSDGSAAAARPGGPRPPATREQLDALTRQRREED